MTAYSGGHAYRFKQITSIPEAKALVDIVLSQTQRRTPTVVHPQFKISRIRSFYMRKVKFCQQTFHDKLSLILTEFPRLDDIHPFYADLCNVLYDRDHFKLALGQVNAVRAIVDRAATDYVRLLKYADSPYKCKMLKRAALGRMCTAIKKLGDSLKYLEEVRQHLSRLPSIDPYTRTLILAGFPNVGKSSFMNSVTNANVEVQPYAFTTKSLYAGHFDWGYTRWQVIDTPGILDHPLANRNTIELTAITALAHIPAAILFFVDISEQCGFSLEDQVSLFHSIKVLFNARPLVLVLNKVDVVKLADLEESKQALLHSMTEGLQSDAVAVLEVSCLTAAGVDEAKNKACEMLLARRVEAKVVTKRAEAVANRLHATSVAPAPHRPPCIPPSVVVRAAAKLSSNDHPKAAEAAAARLARDVERDNGGPGVFSVDLNASWLLGQQEWKYDLMPEIFNGKNVLDFVDPDVDAKLRELEREESELLRLSLDHEAAEEESAGEWHNVGQLLADVHRKRKQQRVENMMRRNLSRKVHPRRSGTMTLPEMGQKLKAIGYRLKGGAVQAREQKRIVGGHRANLSGSDDGDDEEEEEEEVKKNHCATVAGDTTTKTGDTKNDDDDGDVTMAEEERKNATSPLRVAARKKLQLLERARLKATPNRGRARDLIERAKRAMPNRMRGGLNSEDAVRRAETVRRKAVRGLAHLGRKGEADRFIGTKKPIHLFSGKRGIGKADRR